MQVSIHLTFRQMFVAMLFICLAAATTYAQTAIAGQFSGKVTDGIGAVLPGVTVTVTNEATLIERTATTNGEGFYVVTNLQPGNYRVTCERVGFKRIVRAGFNLVADGRLTVDFMLETGQVSETIEITSQAGETVNMTSGEMARVVDAQQVQDMALNGRNYMQLTTLIPGTVQLDDDSLELTTSLSTSTQAINGNRGNTSNLTIDGGFNLGAGSNASQINNVGIDFIQEVKIQTSNFSAEYGRNSGAAINVVTRSGGNRFHGSVFEFLRNDALDARNFFAPTRPALRYNNFGYSLGGPVIKNRFFFFLGQEWKYIRRSTDPVRRTLPTAAERSGDFSQRLRGADGIPGTDDDGFLRDPRQPASLPCGVVNGQRIRSGCFPGNVIPGGLITADGRALATLYGRMAGEAASFTDSPIANNAIYQLSNPFDFRQEVVRLDYRFNQRHSIYGRYLHDSNKVLDPFGTFINSQLPTVPTDRLRPGTSYLVSHTWLVNSRLVNEAKGSTSFTRQRVIPDGDVANRSTYGFTFPEVFPFNGIYLGGLPNVSLASFSGFSGPAAALTVASTDISFSDNLTLTHSNHTLKLGGVIIRNRGDRNGQSPYNGSINFNPAGNPRSTGNAFADALLGNFRSYTEAPLESIGRFRFSQFEAFASDNWRLHPRLSLEYGVRYQHGTPTYALPKNFGNFDPGFYDPLQAVTVLPNGAIDPARGGNRFNGLIRPSGTIPADEIGRIPGGITADIQAVPAAGRRGGFAEQHLFAPRFSFAYAPFNDGKTAIRGGFGIFYDKPEGNLIFSLLNNPPFVGSVQFNNGNLSNPSGGTPSALAPFGQISALNPDLVLPYTMNFSLSVQRELPRGVFVEIAYVGNNGRHLLRRPDINQAPFDVLRANAARPSGQQASVDSLRPYKGYSEIRMSLSDSTSNYNALQLYATKRKGRTTFTASYTWSKALTTASGNSDNPEDPFNQRYNYGPASFDRRHIFVTTYTYKIGSLARLGYAGRVLLSGWELSGITRLQAGGYLTVTGNTSIGTRRADYVGGEISLGDDATPRGWFNTSAFRRAPDDRRGTASMGMVLGPGSHRWDMALRRQIPLGEKVRLRLQADFFNIFNRANFRDLNTNVSSQDFGSFSEAGPGRNIQLGAKIEF
jgi:Carboxypeptidase regulatory-like domain